jgi:hypothetical protein
MLVYRGNFGTGWVPQFLLEDWKESLIRGIHKKRVRLVVFGSWSCYLWGLLMTCSWSSLKSFQPKTSLGSPLNLVVQLHLFWLETLSLTLKSQVRVSWEADSFAPFCQPFVGTRFLINHKGRQHHPVFGTPWSSESTIQSLDLWQLLLDSEDPPSSQF